LFACYETPAAPLLPSRKNRLLGKRGALAYAMQFRFSALPLAIFVCLFVVAAGAVAPDTAVRQSTSAAGNAAATLALHVARTSPLDLELAGDLIGLPVGAVRYVTREELLALPQVNFMVTDDPNFTAPTAVSGVLLEELAQPVGAHPGADLIVAICDDLYRGDYPRDYVAAHHPVLVLTINGKSPDAWPKDSKGHGVYIGPYLITHREFRPRFKILAHAEEAQIPWGVVRLEFLNEQAEFDAIAPRGPHAHDASVQDGYRIAQQNCLRCHNRGDVGGQKAGRPWLVLGAWATAKPEYFAAYVRNPQSKNPHAEMPGNPGYDDATMQALIAYFRAFLVEQK
jgi:mono/diheme cytochrome c family protein